MRKNTLAALLILVLAESSAHAITSAPVCNKGCVGSAPAVLGNSVAISGQSIPTYAGGLKAVPPSATVTAAQNALIKSAASGNGINATALFDSHASDTDVQNEINSLTLPYPPATLTPAQAATPAGIEYKARVAVLTAKLSLAGDSLKNLAGYYRPDPSITDDAIRSLASLISLSNPPSAPMSQDDLMSMMVNGLYANPGWLKWLANTNEAGAWRAASLLNALSLAESRRNHDLKARLAALMAANLAIKAQPTAATADQSRAIAADQSIR